MYEELRQEEEEQKKKKRVIIIVLAVAVALALGLFVGLKLAGGNKSDTSGVSIDPSATAIVKSDESTQGVAIPGWGSFTIPPNTTQLDGMVDFYNPEENEGLYYLTYELRIKDNSLQGYETLYTSGLIPPGQHITSITLSRGLDAGEYEGIVFVQPYKMDDEKTPTNNATMDTTIVVQ